MSETTKEDDIREWVYDFHKELDIDLIKLVNKLKDHDLSDTLLSLWVALETDNILQIRKNENLKELDREKIFSAFRNTVWFNTIELRKEILQNDESLKVNKLGF